MMRNWGKYLFAAAAPLMLASCLWGPGKFTSDLALKKGGSFTLDYRGEILLQLPNDKGSPLAPWSDKKLLCYKNGKIEIVDAAAPGENNDAVDEEFELKACTPAEIAGEKAKYEMAEADRLAKKQTENEQMAKMFGLPGDDDESNRRFAANMMKYQGWRSVRYVGKGVFDVDYHFEGRVGQDYAFPMMPDADFIIPFVTIRRRNDGAVMVTAPALTGGSGPFGARARMMGLPDKNDGPTSRANGVFAITTDGDILTNNSEDGPAAAGAGKRVHWDVGPESSKVPEMLVRL